MRDLILAYMQIVMGVGLMVALAVRWGWYP